MAVRKILDGDETNVFVRRVGFVIETWRQAALGHANAPKFLRDFRDHCGDAAEGVFEDYFSFLHLLGQGSRRRLAVGHPGCPGMTRDEIQVLALLAAAQAGHGTLFDAHLCWLVPEGPRARISQAALRLAAALADCGVEIAGRLKIEHAPRENFRGLAVVRKPH